MRPIASVIILNWNGKQYLERCLTSVFSQRYKDYEVIFVDNASKDGSVDFVRNRFPKAKVIVNDKNLGFSGGNNVGISEAKGEYIVMLNNDTWVDKNWLKNLVEAANKDEKVAICVSKVLFMEKPDTINSCGIKVDVDGSGEDIGFGKKDGIKYQRPKEIFAASGGVTLVKKRVFDEIGLFDSTYFLYIEDVDLSWRARLAGYKVMFVPTARVFHKLGGANVQNKTVRILTFRNRIKTLIKNYSFITLLRLTPTILNSFFKKSTKSERTDLTTYTQILGYMLVDIPYAISQHFKVQKIRKVSDDNIISMMKIM